MNLTYEPKPFIECEHCLHSGVCLLMKTTNDLSMALSETINAVMNEHGKENIRYSIVSLDCHYFVSKKKMERWEKNGKREE